MPEFSGIEHNRNFERRISAAYSISNYRTSSIQTPPSHTQRFKRLDPVNFTKPISCMVIFLFVDRHKDEFRRDVICIDNVTEGQLRIIIDALEFYSENCELPLLESGLVVDIINSLKYKR